MFALVLSLFASAGPLDQPAPVGDLSESYQPLAGQLGSGNSGDGPVVWGDSHPIGELCMDGSEDRATDGEIGCCEDAGCTVVDDTDSATIHNQNENGCWEITCDCGGWFDDIFGDEDGDDAAFNECIDGL